MRADQPRERLVMCFPPIPPPPMRRSGEDIPVKWTACRGSWLVSETDAIALMDGRVTPDLSTETRRVSYRCPNLRKIILNISLN